MTVFVMQMAGFCWHHPKKPYNSQLFWHSVLLIFICSVNETDCMIIQPRDRSELMSIALLQFNFDGNLSEYVRTFKY